MPPEDQNLPGAGVPIPQSTQAVESPIQTTMPPVVATPTPPPGEPDETKMDPSTKAYIQKLRQESAKYRTEAKTHKEKLESVKAAMGVQGVNETPEAQAARLAAEREQVTFENAVLTNAIKHGVSEEGMEFFQFLLAKEAGKLKDGEELSSDRIADIARDAKAKSVKPQATTTVVNPNPSGGGAGNAPTPTSNVETLTVEKFAGLGFNEKCKLWESNPALYEQLMAQATQKRLLK